jgi:hypothetical protein
MGESLLVANLRPLHKKPRIPIRNATVRCKQAKDLKINNMAARKNKNDQQHGGITDKQDKNAGSGAFNQGAAQDPDYNNVFDNEQVRFPRKSNESKDEDWGNVGKSNAGGNEQGSDKE